MTNIQNTPPTLPDTDAIALFMRKFGQPVHARVVAVPPEADRVLRGRLVLEETFELIAALGLKVSIDGSEPVAIDPKSVIPSINPDVEYDPVETLDALGDIIVVTKGSGLQLGLPVDEAVLDQVCPSNMSKLGADGKPFYDEGGKILKGPDFFPPNINSVLKKYTD